ncbi:DNA polymerase III subunit delta' [Thiobacter aerophilum]|uniref:DNA polymerase III subunit delta' n=1 Tax=Thiobacter aerophilum TaxID=3121275 RepID=A0ABV0EC82_9BURK
MPVYPWQTEVWQRLTGARQRLPHALLLQGRRGIGKRDFALALANWLLCQAPTPHGPCRHCRACHLLAVGNHADLRLIEPLEGEEEGRAVRQIAIAQVRELEDFVGLSTHQEGARVIVIHPAEAMNPAAANALLKTLEEPAENTVFLLVSHKPRQLLPTVVSRCRTVAMPLPDEEMARAWLESQGVIDARLCLALAGGAPLEALRYADGEYLAARGVFLAALGEPAKLDWLKLAEQGARQDLASQIDWLQKWLYDLVAVRLARRVRYNPDFAPRLRELGAGVKVEALLRFVRELEGVRRHLDHPLNPQLLLETVFLAYQRAVMTQNG